MLRRALPFVCLLSLAAAQVALPTTGGPRFVDFHRDLAHPGAIVAIGTLGKWKEGKRERLADGQLGGAGALTVVSGTQYFKVPVTAALQPRAHLLGKADGVVLTFDVQLARLPDGKEHRQTKDGSQLAEGTLAMFVIAPRPKKGFELRAVVVGDAAKGGDAEALFGDAMRDHFAINRRMHDLATALERVAAAKDEAGKGVALAALRELVAEKPQLKQPANDALLQQHAGPFEQRAEQALAQARPAADK